MASDVAITGTGAVTPLGRSVEETWRALAASEPAPMPPANPSGTDEPVRGARAAVLSAAELNVTAREAWLMGRHGLLLVQAGREAMHDASLHGAGLPAERIGAFAAMGSVDPAPEDLGAAVLRSSDGERLDLELFFREGYRSIHPLWPLSALNNVGFSLACRHLGVSGENAVFSPGGDAALLAVVEATCAVEAGRAKVALAAGVSETLCAASLARSWLCGESSEVGPLLGEGCAAVALERLADAEARGAAIAATVAGWGFACSEDAPTAIRSAAEEGLRHAGLAVEDIDAVFVPSAIAYGRGNAEVPVLADLVAGSLRTRPLLAVPRSIGNTLAAEGIVSLVIAARALSLQHLPAALAVNGHPAAARGAPAVRNALRRPLRRIVVVSLGHGGQAASLVIEGAG